MEFGNALVAFDRGGELEIFGELVLAKIRRLEEFLDEDDVGALGGGLADEVLGAREA